MNSFKRLMVAMLVVAVILGTAGIAAAAIDDVVGTRYEESVEYLYDLGVVAGRPDGFYPEQVITRAEAAKIVIMMTGKGDLAALLKGAPSFPDVPATHWASGYIALAKNMGIVGGYPDGTFHPDEPVTYAQFAKMMVEAAGLRPTAGLTWPANYVDAAQKAGMLDDVPDFEAGAPATRGDCAIMAAFTIQNVEDPETGLTLAQSVFGESVVTTLTLTPATATVGVGEAVQFLAVAKDDEGVALEDVDLTWTTSDPAVSAVNGDGLFVATEAGTYTVTVEANPVATATVVVYGEPEGLKATASRTTVPANGETVIEITVEVVDENGNRVADAEDEIAMAHDEDNGAVALGDTPLDAEDGVAVFEVTATDNPEVTDTVIFTSGDLDEATVEITTVEQVATAIDVTADPDELMANEEDFGTVTATVLDQDGEDMVFGVYELTFAIDGPGLLDGDTDDVDAVTVGQQATLDVSSEKGDPGTFTVTVTGDGLATGHVDVTTYIAGSPKALEVAVEEGKGEAGDTDDMEFTVTIVDKFGHPTISDDDVTVNFEADDDDAVFFGLGALTIFSGDSRDTVEFHGQTAGTFTIAVEDDADDLTGTSFQCTVVPGDAAVVVLTPHLDDFDLLVPISNPKAIFTAQIEDQYGNAVPEAGVELIFEALEDGNRGEATFSPDDEVETDATGKATVTLVAQPYVGDAYAVSVDADFDGDTTDGAVVVADVIPASLAILTEDDLGHSISRIGADAGETVTVTVELDDSNGNLVGDGFLIEVVFANDGDNVQTVVDLNDDNGMEDNGDGEYWFYTDGGVVDLTFEGAKAGSFSIKATALEVSPTISKSKSFRTTVGTVAEDVRIFKTDGKLAENVDYDAEDVLQLKAALVDNGDNPIVAEADTLCTVTPDNDTAQYRATASGTEITQFTIDAGKTYETLYYVDGADGVDVDLFDDAFIGLP